MLFISYFVFCSTGIILFLHLYYLHYIDSFVIVTSTKAREFQIDFVAPDFKLQTLNFDSVFGTFSFSIDQIIFVLQHQYFIIVFSTYDTYSQFDNSVIVSTFQIGREITVLLALTFCAKNLLFTLQFLYVLPIYALISVVFLKHLYDFSPFAPLHCYIYFNVSFTAITYLGHYRITVLFFALISILQVNYLHLYGSYFPVQDLVTFILVY